MSYGKSIETEPDAEVNIYGRRLYGGSRKPAVTLNLTKHSGEDDRHYFTGEFTVSPRVARKIAKHLLKAADAAESEV